MTIGRLVLRFPWVALLATGARAFSPSPAWLVDGGQSGAFLGFAISSAGDVNGDGFSDILIGAHGHDGAFLNGGRVSAYFGDASGTPDFLAWISVGDQADADWGISISTAGDVNGDGFDDVIIGAPRYDNGQTDEGRATVYHGSPSGLGSTAAWTAESGQVNARFGEVAGAGDVNGDGFDDVIVGCPRLDNGHTDEGRAYLYFGSPSGLSAVPAWMTESDQTQARFGVSVAGAGDLNGDGFDDVVVGADQYDVSQTDQGAVFVYLGSASGPSVAPSAILTTGVANAHFGTDVSIVGDTNADGFSDILVGTWVGTAHTYAGAASGTPSLLRDLSVIGGLASSFGLFVAPAGDFDGDGFADVAVSAPTYDGSAVDQGAVYFIQGSRFGPAQDYRITDPNPRAGEWFGLAALAGDLDADGFSELLIGAPFRDATGFGEGRAFLYGGQTIGSEEVWYYDPLLEQHRTGSSLSGAADFNADGFSDVLVGAPGADILTERGRAFAYYGGSTLPGILPDWDVQATSPGGGFGLRVANAGDINGDGFDDAAVSELSFNRVNLYYGSATGLHTDVDDDISRSGIGFGSTMAAAGDVNGDGYGDLLIGGGATTTDGAAHVYFGSPSGLAGSWTAAGPAPSGEFGRSLAGAGDVNGDGYSDIIIGAPFAFGKGAAYVYFGSPSGPSSTPDWSIVSDQSGSSYGIWVTSGGDVNADGFSDIVVCAANYIVGSDEGAVFVYHGSPGGPGSTYATRLAETPQLSGPLAGVGDMNGDGYSDLVISVRSEDSCFLFFGSPTGIPEAEGTFLIGASESTLGSAIAWAGDMNADGFAEFVFGDPSFDGQLGRMGLMFGNDNGQTNFPWAPQQADGDDTRLVPWLGATSSGSALRVRVQAHSAAGRPVRVQLEVKPAGTGFDGLDLIETSFVDTGSTLSLLVDGLTPGSLYRWRARCLTDSPYFPYTRWMTCSANGSEPDLRTAPSVVAVETSDVAPSIALARATPNPFRAATELRFSIATSQHVRAGVFDVQGREVARLVDGVRSAGSHAVRWDASGFAPGAYFARVEAGGAAMDRKIVLLP